jgi:hypothetical protein
MALSPKNVNICSDGYANYPDLIIPQYTLKHHNICYKYIQKLCVIKN